MLDSLSFPVKAPEAPVALEFPVNSLELEFPRSILEEWPLKPDSSSATRWSNMKRSRRNCSTSSSSSLIAWKEEIQKGVRTLIFVIYRVYTSKFWIVFKQKS